MNGIHAQFTGRLGQDAQLRTTRDGKIWAAFPVCVNGYKDNELAAAWVRCALFGDTVSDLAPRLTKGIEVYVEGRLTLRPWVDADGRERSGLSLATAETRFGPVWRRYPTPYCCA